MSGLIRVIYASRASFATGTGQGIEPEVARILAQSRRNNARNQVVGALHFADGCFLQCLEGPADAVRGVLRRVAGDSRHSDLKVLREQAIQVAGFRAWSMKFVPAAADVRDLLAGAGLDRFDPYRFDARLLERFVALLQDAPTAAAEPAVPADVAADASPAVEAGSRPGRPAQGHARGRDPAWWALGLSMLALALAAVALIRSV
jgi:hypothetical protein